MRGWLFAVAVIAGWFGPTMSVEAAWQLKFLQSATDLPGGAIFEEREAEDAGRAVRIQTVFFSLKKCRLEVLDNDPKRESLEAGLVAAGCFAGVNGGYFHESFKPVGLMISNGRTANEFERAKLLSGVLVVKDRKAVLLRSSEFKPSDRITDALQAGPFLVDDGEAVKGLSSDKVARRTVIASAADGRWALLLFSHVSLEEMATLLTDPTVFPDIHFERALNLDGGSSSGLWANITPKPFYLRGFATVRSFVGLRLAE